MPGDTDFRICIVAGLSRLDAAAARTADISRVACLAKLSPFVTDFEAIVSCQTISATGAATVTNVSTAPFPASTAGNSDINATVSLPHPCIAPIVFVFGAPNVGWFAATGG